MGKSLFHASHQLFADSVNQAGVLDNFFSEDDMEKSFGSCGSWEEVEGYITSAIGFPSGNRLSIPKILSTFDRNVCSERPYCRVLLLPVHEGSEFDIHQKTNQRTSSGEVLIDFNPFQLMFQQQIDFFCATGNEEEKRLYDCEKSFSIIVWINRAFQMLHPPPSDVEECLLKWSIRWFDDAEIFNLDAVPGLFPHLLRNGLYVSESY